MSETERSAHIPGIVPARLRGMTIYEAIKETIKEAMKARDQKTLDFARVVKAELDRKGDGKPLPDEEAVKVLRPSKRSPWSRETPLRWRFWTASFQRR